MSPSGRIRITPPPANDSQPEPRVPKRPVVAGGVAGVAVLAIAAFAISRGSKEPADVAAPPVAKAPASQPAAPPSQTASKAAPQPPAPPAIPEPPAAPPAPATSHAEWPGWRGPDRDGKSPDTGLFKTWPAGGPELLWQVGNVGAGYASAAVSDGLVYTAGDVAGRLTIFTFSLAGEPQWQVDHDSAWTKSYPGSRSTPMIDGGHLYLVSGHGLVGCYDAKTGQRKWTREMHEFGGRAQGWGYAESVLIHENLAVVTPGGSNCIVALDKGSGKTVWMSQGFNAPAQYGSCIAITHAGTPMIIAGTRGGIVGVDARNGRVLWSNGWSAGNTANCPTPAFADGYVFWANGYGKGGVCLELASSGGGVSARQAWTTRNMVCHHGGYVIHEGYIYGNHGSGWACLDVETGEKQWQERGVGKGSLCFADGMLYLFSEDGGRVGLASCSPDGMEVESTFSVRGRGKSWAHPIVVGGRLYLRYDTNLYCYDVRGK